MAFEVIPVVNLDAVVLFIDVFNVVVFVVVGNLGVVVVSVASMGIADTKVAVVAAALLLLFVTFVALEVAGIVVDDELIAVENDARFLSMEV